jgi:ribose transport system permease protein
MPSVSPREVMRIYGLIMAWLVVIAIFGLARPETFLTTGTLQTILGSQAVLLILSLGLIVPFICGEFDLSISGVLSVSLVLVGYLNVIHGWPIGQVIVVVLLAGAVIGLVNAFFVIVVGVDSIVVTLGMGTLLIGAGVGINNVTTAGVSSALVDAVNGELLGIPLGFFYALVLTVLLWYVLDYTPLGRYLYFVGAGRDVARLAGIRVNAIRTASFVVSGVISALAGIVLAGTLGAGDANIASSYLLPAFAAVFLGATTIHPGRFNAWGTFVAVYFLITGITGLELLGLSGWIEQVYYGSSLVLAVAFSRLAGRRAVKEVAVGA